MVGDLYTQSLNRRAGFHVVAHATSVDEAIRVVRTANVDVALIGTMLVDGPQSGLIALQKIQELCPCMKSVLVLHGAEEDLVVPAFRSGARGVFLPTIDGFKSLCRCVEKVHAGQIWANSAQLLQVLAAFSRQAPQRIVDAKGASLLTNREEDIVRLVEEGLTNRQIACELELSEHTVRNNLFRIFDKLGVSSRIELALYSVNSSRRAGVEDPRRPDRKLPVQADPPSPIRKSAERA